MAFTTDYTSQVAVNPLDQFTRDSAVLSTFYMAAIGDVQRYSKASSHKYSVKRMAEICAWFQACLEAPDCSTVFKKYIATNLNAKINFNKSTMALDLAKSSREVALLGFKFLHQTLGNTVLSETFSLTEEDFKQARVLYPDKDLKYREFLEYQIEFSCCFTYALYEIHEDRAFPFLFETDFSRRKLPRALIVNPVEFFVETWGYSRESVPRAGDLVIYVNDEGVAKHIAVVNSGTTAKSKLGFYPNIVEHAFAKVSKVYGSTYYFLRPPSLSHTDTEMIACAAEVRAAKWETSVWRCPHSPKGVFHNLMDEYQQRILYCTKRSMPFSPKGRPFYMEKLQRLKAFDPTLHDYESVFAVFDTCIRRG